MISLKLSAYQNRVDCVCKTRREPGLVAHACIPSDSGGRDQEDRGSKSAQANSSKRPYLKTPITKKGVVEWLKVKALNSSPNTANKQTQNPEEGLLVIKNS
jgi:hypothetical protein